MRPEPTSVLVLASAPPSVICLSLLWLPFLPGAEVTVPGTMNIHRQVNDG